MDTHMIIEIIGYIGSLLVLVSFLMSSVVKLRVINSIGGFIFAIYAIIIQSYPTALMNVCLVGINIYYLVRLKNKGQHFGLIDGTKDDALIKYMLEYYKEDINTYFPGWDRNLSKADTAYVVFCDAVPAGVSIGRRKNDTMEMYLDYSTPTYRDCSVGRYLYSCLPAKGIGKLVFENASEKHVPYLNKVGFVMENGVYVKKLN